MSSRGVDDEAGSRRWAHGSGACGLHRSEGRALHGRRRLSGDLRQPRSRGPPLPRGIALPLDLADLRSDIAQGLTPEEQVRLHYRNCMTIMGYPTPISLRRPRRPGAELAATAQRRAAMRRVECTITVIPAAQPDGRGAGQEPICTRPMAASVKWFRIGLAVIRAFGDGTDLAVDLGRETSKALWLLRTRLRRPPFGGAPAKRVLARNGGRRCSGIGGRAT